MLPLEIVINVASFLDTKIIMRDLSLVCKEWASIKDLAVEEIRIHEFHSLFSLNEDQLISHLARYPNLKHITNMSFRPFAGSDSFVENLARCCPQLRSISLSKTGITDQTLDNIAKYFPDLVSLDISYCTKLTDRALKRFFMAPTSTSNEQTHYLTKLKKLAITGCDDITDNAFDLEFFDTKPAYPEYGNQQQQQQQQQQPMVDQVAVYSTNAEGSSQQRRMTRPVERDWSLSTLRNLTGLWMAHIDQITDFAMINICNVCKHLEEVDIRFCVQLSDVSIEFLVRSNADSLRFLCASACPLVKNKSLEHLAVAKNLETLLLADCPNITDAGLVHLRPLPLKTLDLSNDISITDEGIDHLAVSNANRLCQSLQTLHLRQCYQITRAPLESYQRKFPKLQTIAF